MNKSRSRRGNLITIHWRARRGVGVPELLVSITVIFLLLMPSVTGFAQSADPADPSSDATTVVEEATTDPIVATETPTPTPPAENPTDTPATEPVNDFEIEPTTIPTESPIDQPATAENTSTSTTQPALEQTSTPPTGGTQEITPAAIDGSGVRITFKSGDNFGPPLANVCMTLISSFLGVWQDSGCTDANGQVTLEPILAPVTGVPHTVLVLQPSGYQPIDDIAVNVVPGQVLDLTAFAQPAPAVSVTFNAIDESTEAPVSGACWSLYTNTSNQIGNLITGPICDEDNDGTTLLSDVPAGSYCYVASPPIGHVLLGTPTICSLSTAVDNEITRAFISGSGGGGDPGTGILNLTIQSTWGEPLANVCVSIEQKLTGGGFVDISSGCSDADGSISFENLADGQYIIDGRSVPDNFSPFSIETTMLAPNGVNLTIPVPSINTGSANLTAYFAAGPETIGGACWSYTTNIGGQPGSIIVVGPVCDGDNDGKVTLNKTPYGSFCLSVTPPAGWYRPGGDYFTCNDHFGFSANWRVGFVQIPPSPTASASKTPSATPTPTPTPLPTAPPAGDEPKGNVTVRNCEYFGLSSGSRDYYLCQPVEAGVRFAVIQAGQDVATIMTQIGGFAVVDLPARSSYKLRYLDGNDSTYVVGPGENERIRYGAAEAFTFVKETPAIQLTMVVKTQSISSWNNNTPIGGACYRIIDDQGGELLPSACDTDNDGAVVVGTLPAELAGYYGLGFTQYRAEMVLPPPGYDPIASSFGLYGNVSNANTPDIWTATVQYQPVILKIHTVDPDGNPLSGFGYSYATTSNGVGLLEWDASDGADDGTTTHLRLPGNTQLWIRSVRPRAGYATDLETQTLTTSAGGTMELTFVARPYGSESASTAILRIVITDADDSSYRELQGVCVTLSPNSGVPTGRACADDPDNAIIFRNLPIGNFTPVLSWGLFGNQGCSFPTTIAPILIANSDLGTTVNREIVVSCGYSGGSCTVIRDNNRTARTVDIYYGELRDRDSGDSLASGMELSESISYILVDDFLRSVNPDPQRFTLETLAPWTLSLDSDADWANQPDWDGNARRALLTFFDGVSPDAIAEQPVLKHTVRVTGGTTLDTYITGGAGDPLLKEFPECDQRGMLGITVVTIAYVDINIYEMNAETPQDPPTPTPTPWPSPEPVCTTEASRDITIAYGSIIDSRTGAVFFSGLESSDPIPQEIADAIKAGDAPEEVAAMIDGSVDPGLDPGEWPFGGSSGEDALANLRTTFESQANEVVLQGDGSQRSASYEVPVYRYVNESELPDKCFIASEFGLLVPLTQQTTANVTFIELNATLGGITSPKPTRTPGAHPSPTATPIDGKTITTLPNTGTPSTRKSGIDLSTLFVLLGGAVTLIVVSGSRRARRQM